MACLWLFEYLDELLMDLGRQRGFDSVQLLQAPQSSQPGDEHVHDEQCAQPCRTLTARMFSTHHAAMDMDSD